MDVLLIVFLTLLNGVFAMSEMALASSRKARLAALEESGDKGATGDPGRSALVVGAGLAIRLCHHHASSSCADSGMPAVTPPSITSV